jgi:hypothetical protein
MRDTLSDIIKQTNGLFPSLYVEGTDTETSIRAMTDDKNLILSCVPKAPLVDLRGEVGINDLGILNGLLNFSSYNSEDASFTVQRANRQGKEFAELFSFRDGKKAGSNFRLANPATIPDDKVPPKVNTIAWEIEFEPNKSKVTEFTQLANLYSKGDNFFAPKTQDSDLLFLLGEETSTTHNASIVFEENVTAELKGTARYSIASFLALMKLSSQHPVRLGLTSRGVMGVSMETSYATYSFVLRANR